VGTSQDGPYVQYDGSVNVAGTRSWRDNNPGNIEAGSFADAHGAIGSDGRFAIFPDAGTGMQALVSLLSSDGYQGLTIEQAMERYAPLTLIHHSLLTTSALIRRRPSRILLQIS
jgi:hypothetical protein